MADQKPPDQPPGEPSNRAESGMLPEQELDDVLAKASALAADLSDQVGAPTGAEPTIDASLDPLTNTGARSDLEAELGELERLVAHTGKEFDNGAGTAAKRAAGAPRPAPGGGETPSTAAAIPDFMAEFTQPETVTKDPTARPARTSPSPKHKGVDERSVPQPPAAPGPDVLDSASPGAATPSLEPAPGARQNARQPRRQAASAAKARSEAQPAPRGQANRGPASILKSVATRLSGLAITVLEFMDRPIARSGDGVRRVIGWTAIATIGTAAIVYLYSLL